MKYGPDFRFFIRNSKKPSPAGIPFHRTSDNGNDKTLFRHRTWILSFEMPTSFGVRRNWYENTANPTAAVINNGTRSRNRGGYRAESGNRPVMDPPMAKYAISQIQVSRISG
jgi:hypothetical protein